MRRWLVRIALGLAAAAVALAAVVIVRAANVTSLQGTVEPVDLDLEVDEDAAVARLAAAIRRPTVSPVTSEEDAAAFVALREQIADDFPLFHEIARREIVGDLTLHFSVEGSEPGRGHVVFLAHQDVVPVEEGTEDDWSYPPFSGEVAEGYVWGRGTLDNKQSMMALLEAAELWLEGGGRPAHTVHFVFGHDEEVGGMEGARAVAAAMERQELDVVAVYDEGLVIAKDMVPGVHGSVALIGITERGYLSVEITATAKGGHSSMPPDDVAVVRLADALAELDDRPMRAAIDGPTRMMFDWLAPEMSFGHRLLFRNLWLFEPMVLLRMTDTPGTNAAVRTTAAPTMLRASERENVLPQKAVATVNLRLHPRDDIESVLAYLDEVIADEHVSVEPLGEMRAEPSPLASMEGPGFEALRRALATVYPDVPVAPNMLIGASDARHFTGLTSDVYRFQPVRLDEDDLSRIHGTSERIAVDDYLALIRYYAALLSQW